MANHFVARHGIISLGDITGSQSIYVLNDINVDQNVNVAGNLNIDGNTRLGDATSDNIVFVGHVSSSIIPQIDDTFDLGTGVKRWAHVYAENVDVNGSLGVSGSTILWGDLDVKGTTTTIHTDDLYVKDIHIVIADGLESSLEADGAGLYISGADVNFAWDHSGQYMTLSKPLSASFVGNASSLTGYEFSNLENTPSGLISGSGQVDHNLTANYTASRHTDHATTSVLAGLGMSGGGTIDSTVTITLDTGSAHFQNAVESAVVEVPAGTVSSSIQVDHNQTTNYSASRHFLKSEIDEIGTVTSGNVDAILPAGTVSGSGQVDYTDLSNVPAGIVSSSLQIDHNETINYTASEHFEQSDITTVGTVTTGDVSGILPAGTVSGSAQASGWSVASASHADFATTASYAENVTAPSLSDVTAIGADTDDFVNFNGGITVSTALFTTASNFDVDEGTEIVGLVPTSSYDGAFFDYVVKKGSNLRSGTVMAVWNAGGSLDDVEYTDTSTQDVGSTSGVEFDVDLVEENARLKATVPSNDWIVRTMVRAL